MRKWVVVLLLVASGQSSSQNVKRLGYGSVAGRVLDADGKPVNKVSVHAESLDSVTFGLTPVWETNENGEFLIPRVSTGAHVILAYSVEQGYMDVRVGNFIDSLDAFPKVTIEEGKTTRGVVVRLGPKGGMLLGTIVDSTTRQAVTAARILLFRLDVSMSEFSTGPDEQGRFQFALPDRPFRMEVVAQGYKKWIPEKIQLTSGEQKDLNILLEPI